MILSSSSLNKLTPADSDTNYKLVRRMALAQNKSDGVYYYYSRQHDVNENTLALLYALVDERPHSQKDISEEWLIPKTTVNSIVKKLSSDGYITFGTQTHMKEKQLILTDKGKAYADNLLGDIYKAEEYAIKATLDKFNPEFVDALEYYSECLYKFIKTSGTSK